MPNPYIEWTDAVGLARLTCLVPVLSGWTPDVDPIGPAAVALGSGTTYRFRFRTDYPVRFVFPYLTPLQITEVLRLKSWLMDGNSVTLFTGDLAARIYTVKLRPDTTPEITQDPENLEFSLALEVINTTGLPLLASWVGVGLMFTPDTDYAGLGGTFSRTTTATYLSGP
jgi:hypothetical protein